jgi:hypothetical protein
LAAEFGVRHETIRAVLRQDREATKCTQWSRTVCVSRVGTRCDAATDPSRLENREEREDWEERQSERSTSDGSMWAVTRRREHLVGMSDAASGKMIPITRQ